MLYEKDLRDARDSPGPWTRGCHQKSFQPASGMLLTDVVELYKADYEPYSWRLSKLRGQTRPAPCLWHSNQDTSSGFRDMTGGFQELDQPDLSSSISQKNHRLRKEAR